MEKNDARNPVTLAVAAELYTAQRRSGMMQRDLARAIGISETTVQRYLAGAREIPLPVFVAICDALDVAPGDIMRRALDGQ